MDFDTELLKIMYDVVPTPGSIAIAVERIKKLLESKQPKKKDINIEIPSTLHRNVGYNAAIDAWREGLGY